MSLRAFLTRRRPPDPRTPVILPSTSVDRSSVGAYTYIGAYGRVTRATIGRYTSIADNCYIGMGEHPTDALSTSGWFMADGYEYATRLPCVIGHDVWLGVSVVVRRGVTIGNGAIVGACAFVNKDVPPFAIVAGVPARLIRYRFPPHQIAAIEASCWWEYDLAHARILQTDLARAPPA